MNPLNAPRISVLYVDDFDPERRLMEHRLRSAPVDLASVGTAGEAMDALRAHQFDVVLTDLHLNDGHLGTDFILAARAANLHQGPIVVITGEAEQEVLTPLLDAGACAVLTKPVKAEYLLEILYQLTQSQISHQAAAGPGDAFVTTLPFIISELQTSASRSDTGSTRRLLADLASTAGGYGFTSLARLADQAIGSIDADTPCINAVEGVCRAVDSILTPRSNAA